MKRVPRAAGVLGWVLGAAALHAAVPFQLARLGGRAGRPGRSAPAARHAGLVTVAAGAALMAWAFAAHSATAPQGWELESGLTPGYLLRAGPYRLSRNPMYSGEAVAWAGWGLVYASPAVWAGLASLCAAAAGPAACSPAQLKPQRGGRVFPSQIGHEGHRGLILF